MNSFLSEAVVVDSVMDATAAGATLIYTDGVDCNGFDSVCFIAAFGTLTVAPTLHLEQSDDDGSSDAYSDLEGTNNAQLENADDDLVAVIDIRRPQKRYVRLAIDRTGGNAVVDRVIAIGYDSKERETTQPADVAAHAKHLAPSEGTI